MLNFSGSCLNCCAYFPGTGGSETHAGVAAWSADSLLSPRVRCGDMEGLCVCPQHQPLFLGSVCVPSPILLCYTEDGDVGTDCLLLPHLQKGEISGWKRVLIALVRDLSSEAHLS